MEGGEFGNFPLKRRVSKGKDIPEKRGDMRHQGLQNEPKSYLRNCSRSDSHEEGIEQSMKTFRSHLRNCNHCGQVDGLNRKKKGRDLKNVANRKRKKNMTRKENQEQKMQAEGEGYSPKPPQKKKKRT